MKKILIEKVHLETFVQMLIDILNMDVDFVDIIVKKGKHKDDIFIIPREERDEERVDDVPLSNIDLNELV